MRIFRAAPHGVAQSAFFLIAAFALLQPSHANSVPAPTLVSTPRLDSTPVDTMKAIIVPRKAYPARSSESPVATKTAPVSISRLFHRVGGNFIASLEYGFGMPYVAAGVATYGMVESGLDWRWYRFCVKNSWVSKAGFTSVIAGGLVPMFLPLSLFIYGRVEDKPDLALTGLALGQSALLGLAVSSGIKVFTGRIPPDDKARSEDNSQGFQFGIWRGGAFDGWPSSHTAVAFAMSGALAQLYPDQTGLKAVAFAYAAAVGIGVSTNIHWLSDAVAGALIGYALGQAVGKDFYFFRPQQQDKGSFQFLITPRGPEIAYGF